MQIIDCFIFYNELDLLHIRLEELYDVVDKFVIVEANHTFTGNKKDWNYEKNIERYTKYKDKIIYIKVDDMPNDGNAWTNEWHQRNAIQRSYYLFNDDDIVIISDVDEIPSINTINFLRTQHPPVSPLKFDMSFYNYNFNCCVDNRWSDKVFSSQLKQIRDIKPQALRDSQSHGFLLKNAGWHFSWFGDSEFCKNKIRNFAHQELNNEYFLNRLSERRFKYQDYYSESGRNWKFNRVFLDSNLPKCVLERRFDFIEKYIDQPIKIAFVSYANHVFEKAGNRIKHEAQQTGLFNTIKVFTPSDLDSEFIEKNRYLLSQERGGGYWCWKPHIVLKTMQSIPENEWILYADAGCTLVQERKTQLFEHIDEMEKENKLITAYQMSHLEKDWTKGDMFNYFGLIDNKNISNSGQYVGGVFLVKNHRKTRNMFGKMIEIIEGNSHLIDDSPSIIQNDDSFKEHRHDQSLFSIMRKLNPDIVYVIPKDETYHGNAFVQAQRLR